MRHDHSEFFFLFPNNLFRAANKVQILIVSNLKIGSIKPQLIKFNGYKVDSFTVTTADGYILTIFRCYSDKFPIDQLKPICLVHGMMDTSDTFCLNPGNQSLGTKKK